MLSLFEQEMSGQSKSAKRRAKRRGQVGGPVSGPSGMPRVPVSTGLSASRSGDVGSALGALLGSSFGPFGSVAGGLLGQLAGRKFGQVTGLGAYQVNRNSLLGSDPPVVSNTSCGVRIRHREYICDVVASQDFSTQCVYSINPGLSASFPWLAGVAANYQQWKPWGILYEFITTSGNSVASTNTALGEVIMSTQYNAILPPFTNKQQMLNQEFSCNAVPSVDIIHPIECEPSQTSVDCLYVRTTVGGVGNTNGDIRLADLGTFQLSTQGQQANGGTLGSLFVTYDIELLKPTMQDDTGRDLPAAMLKSGGVDPTNVWGTGGFGEVGTLGTWTLGSGNDAVFSAVPTSYQHFAVYQNWTGTAAAPANSTGPTQTMVNASAITPSYLTMFQGNTFNGQGVNSVTYVSVGGYYALDSLTFLQVNNPGAAWSITAHTGTGSLPTGNTGKSGFVMIVVPVSEQLFASVTMTGSSGSSVALRERRGYTDVVGRMRQLGNPGWNPTSSSSGGRRERGDMHGYDRPTDDW